MGPETRLLLCCARTHMDAEKAESIRTILQAGIDWAYLMQIALLHRMTPLLYWHLHTICPEVVPLPTLDQLRSHFHANARRNLFLTMELLKLLKLFAAQDITAVPFKGPILASAAYGNLSLRQFHDLDVLIHQRDIRRAKAALASLGYRPAIEPLEEQDAEFVQSKHHILISEDGRVRVDLQWRMAGLSFSFPLDTDRFWEHLQPVSFAGTTVLHLSPENTLLLLNVHGCKHHWERLKWICDIAEVIRAHPGMDWERILGHAADVGAERMLALGLFLANDLLGTALPDRVWRRILTDDAVKPLATQVSQRLFREADRPPGAYEKFVFYYKLRERFRDRMHYRLYYLSAYFWIVVTPNIHDRALLPLPAFLSSLYYLLRPMRLLWMYALRPRKLKQVLYEWFESIG